MHDFVMNTVKSCDVVVGIEIGAVDMQVGERK